VFVTSYFHPILIFANKARSSVRGFTRVGSGLIDQDKCLTVTNTLAYCGKEIIIFREKFYFLQDLNQKSTSRNVASPTAAA
jgi:hypothetical protein